MANNEIVLFESSDGAVTLDVNVDAAHEEVWLNRNQLAQLFDRDVKTIGKHVNNALKEELAGSEGVVVAKFATTTPHGAIEGKSQTHQVEHYNLDMILSVGYRVKSQRGIASAREALAVLFSLEEYGIRPVATGDEVELVVLSDSAKSMKLTHAINVWADMQAQLESGAITQDEYEAWKASFDC